VNAAAATAFSIRDAPIHRSKGLIKTADEQGNKAPTFWAWLPGGQAA